MRSRCPEPSAPVVGLFSETMLYDASMERSVLLAESHGLKAGPVPKKATGNRSTRRFQCQVHRNQRGYLPLAFSTVRPANGCCGRKLLPNMPLNRSNCAADSVAQFSRTIHVTTGEHGGVVSDPDK